MARLADLRAAYDGQLAHLVGWLTRLPADAVDRPSRLAGWTVRELAFHTTEVPRALSRALDEPRPSGKALSIADYTARWRDNAQQIADRDRAGAVGVSVATVVERHQEYAAAMHAALDALGGDPVVAARRGPIRTSDLLATRVNELVVHSLDLAASVPEAAPVELDRRALGAACRMLAGILAARVPGRTVELRVPPYTAVQCVPGPRHTRGTPPNVVEVEPVTWVELATGRTGWADAVAAATVRASGERSDLSALLPVLT